MKTIIRILLIILMIGGIAYCGMCVYGNYFSPNVASSVKMPSAKDAPYSLVVKNTATVILTDEVEVFGEGIGNRTYVVDGYWELAGNEFKYHDVVLTMSEQTFGQIDLKRRK